MSKIHINSKGEPGVCRAISKPCPFGSEDSHFSSVAEAEEAYAMAQDLMGNAASGKSKLGSNGERVLTLDSEEGALKIANLLKNEGKTSAISIITIKHALGRPKREDYKSDEDYQSDDEHFWDLSRQEVGEFNEEPHIYQLRTFDSEDEAIEGVYSLDWNDKDLTPPSIDLKVHTEVVEQWKAKDSRYTEDIVEGILDLYTESLIVDRLNPNLGDYGNHDTFVSKINYDHEGGVLKEAQIYFIPELPEE